MRTGATISGLFHGGILLAAVIGLPWFKPPEKETIKVSQVELIDAREFDSRNSEAPEVAAEVFEMQFEDTGGEVGATPDLEIAHEGAITDTVEAPSAQDIQANLDALLVELAQPEVSVRVTEIDETSADPLGGAAMEGMTMGAPETSLPSAGLSRPGAPSLGGPSAPAPFAPPALPTSSTRSDRDSQVTEETPTAPEEDVPEEAVPEEVVPEENPNQLKTAARPVVRPRDFDQQLAAAEAAAQEQQEQAARQAEQERQQQADAEAEQARQAEAERLAQEQRDREALEQQAAALEEQRQAEDEALAAAIAAAAAEAAEAEAETASASQETGAASGPPMTQGEKDGLKFAVQKCWNPPNGLADAGSLKVVLGVQLNPDGTVNGSPTLVEPASISDSSIETAFEAARRAIIRCGSHGYDLPRDKYDQWRNLEISFNPQGVLGF